MNSRKYVDFCHVRPGDIVFQGEYGRNAILWYVTSKILKGVWGVNRDVVHMSQMGSFYLYYVCSSRSYGRKAFNRAKFRRVYLAYEVPGVGLIQENLS